MWQQKWGWGRGIMALIAVLTLLVGDTFAEPPLYAPYGAWRGRIRYAEGPFGGVRTRVHWGNGITPVGGQVLGQLITVGGAFLTSPNFNALLGAGTGEGSNTETAEQKAEKAEQEKESAEIDSLIATAKKKNEDLLDELNKLRTEGLKAAYGVELEKLKFATAPTQLPGNGEENPNGTAPAPAPTPAGAPTGNSASMGNTPAGGAGHPAAAVAPMTTPAPAAVHLPAPVQPEPPAP